MGSKTMYECDKCGHESDDDMKEYTIFGLPKSSGDDIYLCDDCSDGFEEVVENYLSQKTVKCCRGR